MEVDMLLFMEHIVQCFIAIPSLGKVPRDQQTKEFRVEGGNHPTWVQVREMSSKIKNILAIAPTQQQLKCSKKGTQSETFSSSNNTADGKTFDTRISWQTVSLNTGYFRQGICYPKDISR